MNHDVSPTCPSQPKKHGGFIVIYLYHGRIHKKSMKLDKQNLLYLFSLQSLPGSYIFRRESPPKPSFCHWNPDHFQPTPLHPNIPNRSTDFLRGTLQGVFQTSICSSLGKRPQGNIGWVTWRIMVATSFTGWWFQPIWKNILVKLDSSPGKDENYKYLKPPTRL